jgi:hypothetical protein
VPDLGRAGLAAVFLFGVSGFGATRLLLPGGLRRYEPLWVMPVGACLTAVSMTVLGYAQVPFRASLAIVLVATAAVGVYAIRREGPIARATVRRAAWPLWIAALLAAIALIPLFRAGFATVEGQGQDAHLAVGTAIFLQRHPPGAIAPQEAVDRVPLVWGSKQAIYYALGANASLAHLEVFQTISVTAAMMLAMAACGFFLLAVCVLRAPPWAGLVAMGVVGLDRMVLHTIMHPYFNQTWGFFAMSFALVLAWWAVHQPTRGGIALLALFCVVIFLSYPLAFPIALIPLLTFAWEKRHAFSPRRLYHGRRSLLWMVPIALALLIPISAGFKKVESAQNVVFNPGRSLADWGGDLTGWFPEPQFFATPTWAVFLIAIPFLLWGIWLALRETERPLRRAFVGILVFMVAFAIYFRLRAIGYYFHFKLLAFAAPVALTLAVAGWSRTRKAWWGMACAFVLLVAAQASANRELGSTYDQLPKAVLQLRQIDAALPPGKSIRLDVDPQQQNWVAFMLHGQPLCSQKPLLGTSYPHVPTARRADYILTPKDAREPRDATGRPVQLLDAWALWRAKPDLPPGPQRCSQRMVQTVKRITA